MESEVLNFIQIFVSDETTTLFTECACYWFSHILRYRFPESTIMYDPGQVHFATKIADNIYDISGIVANPEDYVDWSAYSSHAPDAELIQEVCINLKGGE